MSDNTMPSSSSAEGRVLVIGAGMAGLAAARELQHRRYDVWVIEARSRIGGRVWGVSMLSKNQNSNSIEENSLHHEVERKKTRSISSKKRKRRQQQQHSNSINHHNTTKIDVGGAILHGTIRNPLSQLCVQMDIATTDALKGNVMLVDEHGWPIDPKQDDRISRAFNQALEQTFQYIRSNDAKESEDTQDVPTSQTKLFNATVVSKQQPKTTGKESSPMMEVQTKSEDDTNYSALHKNNNNKNNKSKKNYRPNGFQEFRKVHGPQLHHNSQQDDSHENVQSTSTFSSTNIPSSSTDDNFGHLFRTIAEQQYGQSMVDSALWRWHQTNLELSCGAPLDQLGYTWNDDEQYGYEGPHVALPRSWQSVLEALAEPLSISYQCPVVAIEIIEHDHDSPHYNTTSTVSSSSLPAPSSNPSLRLSSPSPSRRSIRLGSKGKATTVGATKRTTMTPTTVTTNVPEQPRRRSNRVRKPVNALTIPSHSEPSYDSKNSQSSTTTQQKQKRPPKVHVTLQDGTVLEADHVICTIPLGVLQTDAIQFTPSIPDDQYHAIQSMGCGRLNKCVLSFPHVFWSHDSDFLGVVRDPPVLILNGVPITGRPILIFLWGGNTMEGNTDDSIVQRCLTSLRHMTPHPPPIDYIVTRWEHDPYARMSFSFVPPGISGNDAYSVLGRPLLSSQGRPMVMFAGEHTTPYHPSTLHGAFLSGIREAYRLDLTLEPELNQGLVFDDQNLYQKTFDITRRRKDDRNGNKEQRQTSQVVLNWNKPNETMEKKTTTILTKPTTDPVPSRRSSRALQRMERRSESKGYHHEEDEMTYDPIPSSLEGTMIDRWIHQYDHNWDTVSKFVLPMYHHPLKLQKSDDRDEHRLQQRYRNALKRQKVKRQDKRSPHPWTIVSTSDIFPK